MKRNKKGSRNNYNPLKSQKECTRRYRLVERIKPHTTKNEVCHKKVIQMRKNGGYSHEE